jgi:MFS family permease
MSAQRAAPTRADVSRIEKRTGLPTPGLWLLAGTLVTAVGNGAQAFAVGKLLYDLTGSVAAFGAVLIIEQVLNVLVQFIAGPWVDRGDARRTGIQVEVVRGLCVCLASVALNAQTLFTWVVLLTLVIRTAQPFYRAATFSLAPAVVPGDLLTRFNGYSNICTQAGQLLGIVIAGLVLDRWGASPALLMNGLSFLVSAATLALVAARTAEVEAGGSVAAHPSASVRQLLDAWTEIATLLRSEAGLVWHLVLSTADSIAVYLFNLVSVAIVAERHEDSAQWLSAVDVAFTLGAVVSGFAVTHLTQRWGLRGSVVVGIGGQAACFALLGIVPEARLSLPVALALGACNTVSWTVVMTTLQLRVGKRVKGRIGTARNLLTALLTMALIPLVSTLQAASLDWALLASGGICLVFALIAVVFGSARRAGVALLGARAQLPEAVA